MARSHGHNQCRLATTRWSNTGEEAHGSYNRSDLKGLKHLTREWTSCDRGRLGILDYSGPTSERDAGSVETRRGKG